MTRIFHDDELLMLSGIQHIAFCERQWALIHIEQQWAENTRTVEGKIMHRRVDDSHFFESRGDVLISRSVPIISYTLGLYGICDVVEFHVVEKCDLGMVLKNRKGRWEPIPIEYKRGKQKRDKRDEVQLCAQAICLEEMLNTVIPHGFLFYGQTRHRVQINFNIELRNEVRRLAKKMHQIFSTGITPKPIYAKHCRSCSLNGLCLPKLKKRRNSVRQYVNKHLEEGVCD